METLGLSPKPRVAASGQKVGQEFPGPWAVRTEVEMQRVYVSIALHTVWCHGTLHSEALVSKDLTAPKARSVLGDMV